MTRTPSTPSSAPDAARRRENVPRALPIEVDATPRFALGMSPQRFLRDYWQRRPLLVRNAFANMRNPVAPDDLAGLACEPLALSRIAIHDPRRDRWTLRTGPFAERDFAKLPKTHWTLLVQDVDKWDADAAALLAPFAFLPSWRVDDVMVSYAEDGGSVGAHVDQYDVFLVQGLGRRHWSISVDPQAPTAFRDDAELKLLREFAPTHAWTLEPGDLLYLPPGVPHHGVAIGACMTYSIGMRAPARNEMLLDLAETLAEAMPESLRYGDAELAPAHAAGEIDDAAIARALQAMPWLRLTEALDETPNGIGDGAPRSGTVDSSILRMWFGRFITRYRSAHAAAANGPPLGDAAFARALERGAHVLRNPWSRFAWMRARASALLFAAGESHACSLAFARLMCAEPRFALDRARAANDRHAARVLIDAGHLVLERSARRSPR